MNLILHNPINESHFGIPVINWLTGTKSFRKYKYILDYCLKNNISIIFYLDNYSSSFPSIFSKWIPIYFEFLFWCLINRISPYRIKFSRKINSTKKSDILLSFAYKNLDGNNPDIIKIKNINAVKIFHLTHFIMQTRIISQTAHDIGVDIFIAENNLTNNSTFFRKYFPKYKKNVYILPFVFQNRFKNTKPFMKRLNKCLAMGTIIEIDKMVNGRNIFKEFINFYNTSIVHPLRKEIFLSKNKIKNEIDSKISNFWEKERKNTEFQSNKFLKIYYMLYNGFVSSKRKYFKFDIVKRYNEYKMFITPEEINDMPGIGFVEGMACGCAYLGQNNPMYTDLGLKPNIHYISHDGTLKDVIEKIKYYQKNIEKLEKIANNGYLFATKYLDQEFVAKKFICDLKQMIHLRNKKNKILLECSFKRDEQNIKN